LDRFKTLWAWSAGTAEATGCRVGGCDRRGGRSAPRPSRRSGHARQRLAARRASPPFHRLCLRRRGTPYGPAVRFLRRVPGKTPLPADLPSRV